MPKSEKTVRVNKEKNMLRMSVTVVVLVFYLIIPPICMGREADDDYSQSREKYFVKPGVNNCFTAPENWPSNNNVPPSNRAPKNAKSFAVVLGSGLPNPNPYRLGPSFAVVSNGYPYFIDCGEGAWRGMANACLVNGDWLTKAFDLNKMKYLFLTHLHCDHTVGIPSWILNAYKHGSKASKEIYGPAGTKSMMEHILEAWTIDITEMWEGTMRSPVDGVTVATHEIERDGLIFQDENVKVFAYRKYHGQIKDNFAYRFECADGRIFAFTGDGFFSPGTIKAAKHADVVFIEAFSKDNTATANWAHGSAEDVEYITHAYHLWPEEMAMIQKNSEAKTFVLIHEQDYALPDKYSRNGLLEECKRAGVVEPVFSSVDGDVY